MPANPNVAPKTVVAIDHSSHTIRLTREFDATRAEIFAAWTQPHHVSQWWDAAGEPLLVCEIDLRPGGTFKFVTQGHPDMPFVGVYREIAPPDRLVFEALGAAGRVVFTEVANRTHLTVEIECRSAEHLEQFLQMGVATGTAQTLDNLAAFSERHFGRAPNSLS